MNFIPCVAWVAKGKALSTPHKLQLSPEELKKLVEETKDLCQKNDIEESEDNNSNDSVEETDEQDNSSSEEEIEEQNNGESEEETEEQDDDETGEQDTNESEDQEIVEPDNNEDSDDFDSKYNLNDYDNDDDQNPLITINDLAVHMDNHDDDYLTDQESEGDIEEKEDFAIKDSDNLLIVGHVEESSSVLEIHVYNHEEDSFYVHHDIVLPSYPLALAWLDFHPSDEKPGNYVAVGDMSPVIKIWDLDVVEAFEPDYTLGKMPKKKAKKLKKCEMKYHSDAVICLSWNKNIRNLLASGSADSTVIVWDLEEGTALNQLSFHSNKVQALEWHPTESQFLLSGCIDGLLKIYDCRSNDEVKSWKVEGEIEKVCWLIDNPFRFVCSTDQGFIYSFDVRNNAIEHSFQAHKEAVTSLDISPMKPDYLISASMDRTFKVWDLKDNLKMIKSLKMKVGSIYTAKVAPDAECTVAVGGNNKSNYLKVFNILKGETSNESQPEVKIKSEDGHKPQDKSIQRNVYGKKQNGNFIEGKIKVEDKFKQKNQANKRIIYGKGSNETYPGVKIKSEDRYKQENRSNQRNFNDKKWNKNSMERKIKNEDEFQMKNQTNKRIIYGEGSNKSHQRVNAKSEDRYRLENRSIQRNVFERKVKVEDKFQIKTQTNKRIIYDTDGNPTSICQASGSTFSNNNLQKNTKRKK